MHARQLEFVQKFHYAFQHKSSQSNKVVDALRHLPTVLTILKIKLTDFDSIKDLYSTYEDFTTIWDKCKLNE